MCVVGAAAGDPAVVRPLGPDDLPGQSDGGAPPRKPPVFFAYWTIAKNDAWVRSVVDRRMKVYIGSPETKVNLWDAVNNRSTVFGRELQQFVDAGYRRSGDYLIPPGG